ncbi:hypothetical protein OS493_013311 [Desmophyllum pertusum]|uniref:Uncharacterized protein n=1 Tax=Desmophyllum pertusum TaxID=174260 RepID=A0A9W9YDK4_9CNID|nr:hypothetical protein OS493_013311 [Desmophyllum pertusum]
MENGFRSRGSAAVTITPGYTSKEPKKTPRLVYLLIIGGPIFLCFLVVLIFMLVGDRPPRMPYTSPCLASNRVQPIGPRRCFEKSRTLYFYELHPEKIYQMRRVTPEDIRMHFRHYDPSPNATKNRTDEAMELRQELNALKFNTTLLKLRERKAVHVASAILGNNFGWAPYTQDYYSGDWLLGPDLFAGSQCALYLHTSIKFSRILNLITCRS